MKEEDDEIDMSEADQYEKELDRLRAENQELRTQNRMLAQRSSPAAQPCGCPEFCTQHPRRQFEHLRAALRFIAENGYNKEDRVKAKRALEELNP